MAKLYKAIIKFETDEEIFGKRKDTFGKEILVALRKTWPYEKQDKDFFSCVIEGLTSCPGCKYERRDFCELAEDHKDVPGFLDMMLEKQEDETSCQFFKARPGSR